ncbi:PREDICTED: C-C motif chemokine 28, partial [Chlamydotis macqueenii]|uniref:C-C motif chemokine 28 n=1 Tax=Chlamydotis macqueenii TaxID=187382 RepID=UPI000529EE42
MKRKSCLTNLIAFYNGTNSLVVKRRAADVYHNFSKIFDAVSCNIIIDRLQSTALFPGAFNCCTKISDEIPKGILQRVERFETQKADGLCHLEAV